MNHSSFRNGFTLIELLVYLAVGAILLTMVISLYIASEHAQRKGQTISTVETEGSEAMNTILQSVRNAQTISAPSLGASGTTLTIVTYASSTSPTVFTLASTSLSMAEGATSTIPLTSPQVVITNFSLQNVGMTGTYGSVKVQFTASYATSTTSSGFDSTYSKTFYGSATVRRIPQ